jgi:ABC-type transporter Mla MlaB component
MIKTETGEERDIWCTITGVEMLDQKIVEEIRENVYDILPGNERLYINLKEITSVSSAAIFSLRKMMTEFMNKRCTVRFISVNSTLSEIFEYLTLSSDG